MTKKRLIIISAIRDLLDLALVTQLPGINWMLNFPIIYLHYQYAGPRALITLFENIPGIETLPIFTAAAFSYPDRSVKELSRDRAMAAQMIHVESEF